MELSDASDAPELAMIRDSRYYFPPGSDVARRAAT
jgi:hypothetical protein